MIEDLKAVGKTPLSEKVYSTLVESIVKGTLPPGTKLQEQHVAKQLAVSATPVREAFRRMERDGFIESIPYCGVVVKELTMRKSWMPMHAGPTWSSWRSGKPYIRLRTSS